MKFTYDDVAICEIVWKHAAENNPFRPGYAKQAELIIRDDDGSVMTDDCTLTIEVDLGEVIHSVAAPTATTTSA